MGKFEKIYSYTPKKEISKNFNWAIFSFLNWYLYIATAAHFLLSFTNCIVFDKYEEKLLGVELVILFLVMRSACNHMKSAML